MSQASPKQRLIVYAKRPWAGYAKTRLGKALGEQGSAGVYARLLYTYLVDLICADLDDIQIELAVASAQDVGYFRDAFPELLVRPQVDGDLGQRMSASFAQAFAEGAESVILTGSDVPGLDPDLVLEAFALLEHMTAVIGPAADGGYYLIGMRAPGVDLFRDIAWSTRHVLAQTEALAREQGLILGRVTELYDIDTIADYQRWRQEVGCYRSAPRATGEEHYPERITVMNEKTKSTAINVCLVLIILGVLGATAWVYFSQYDALNRQNLESFIQGFGPWAVLVYAILYIASAPVPFIAPVLSAVGGLLFGALWGTLYTMVVATVSAFVPFTLSRRLGRQWVEAKLAGTKLDDVYHQSQGSGGFMFVLIMRLVPVLPWEVQNYVGGLSRVSPLIFALATMLGIIPGTFSLTFLGAAALNPTSWQFYLAVALKIVTALVPVVAIYWRRAKKKRHQQRA